MDMIIVLSNGNRRVINPIRAIEANKHDNFVE